MAYDPWPLYLMMLALFFVMVRILWVLEQILSTLRGVLKNTTVNSTHSDGNQALVEGYFQTHRKRGS
jgi:hypothetical protein